MDNGMSIRVGQFKAPWMREVLVDSAYQLAAERSILSQLFGQGYSQGAQFTYAMDNMRFMGGALRRHRRPEQLQPASYNSQNTNWDTLPRTTRSLVVLTSRSPATGASSTTSPASRAKKPA